MIPETEMLRLIRVDTLRKVHNVGFSRGTAHLCYFTIHVLKQIWLSYTNVFAISYAELSFLTLTIPCMVSVRNDNSA